jgi:DegV family protein with EDD domain
MVRLYVANLGLKIVIEQEWQGCNFNRAYRVHTAELSSPYPTPDPQVLVWGEETFLDGVDIQPKAFYERLAKTSVMPKSSQASPAAFEKVFRELLAQDYHVLTVVLSAKLSGTMTSALLAKENIGGRRRSGWWIRILSPWIGFQALAAAKASVQGATLAECKALVEAARALRDFSDSRYA